MGSASEAVALVEDVRRAGGTVVLFEQPVAREALEAMAEVARRARVRVAADESVGSARDVARVAAAGAADVVNVKITKSGVAEALDMVATARAHGVGLMIGGMVESSLAMAVSACLAAGEGGFEFVDLDTPMFMAEEPFVGGPRRTGPRIDLAAIIAGHGVVPADGAKT
jgi:L-alanine-DL-glutamate epimerase-like enolase superfamily enzyme